LAGRVIFVTGISGTGIERSLRKFCGWQGSQASVGSPVVVKVENELEGLAAPDIRAIDPDRTPKREDVWTLPKPRQRRLWGEAFEHAAPEVERLSASGHDVFLTFHAAWYHHLSDEFTSMVAPARLAGLQPALVITLIDDIYDVLARLSEPGEVFEEPEPGVRDPLVDWAIKLLKILEWRALDEAVAELIAAECGDVPHVVLAVKHPMRTLAHVLEGRPCAYLSHPITHVRALWQRDDQAAQEEGERHWREVERLAEHMRERVALFEPTTIDEARFSGPTLTRRWPHEDDESQVLWARPPRALDQVPTSVSPPEAAAGLKRELGKVDDDGFRSRLRGLLEQQAVCATQRAWLDDLQRRIGRQVNARDRKLVEQCGFVVQYRPFVGGSRSGGMFQEAQHCWSLARLKQEGGRAAIYHPPSDEWGRRRFLLGEVCCRLLRLQGRKDDQVERCLRAAASTIPDADIVSLHEQGPDHCADLIAAVLRKAASSATDPAVKGSLLTPMSSSEARATRLERAKELLEWVRTEKVADWSRQAGWEYIVEELKGDLPAPILFAQRAVAFIERTTAAAKTPRTKGRRGRGSR